MKSFGTWLWKNRDDANNDTVLLSQLANEAGRAWPITSERQGDYIAIIRAAKQDPDRTNAIEALKRLWVVYEADPDPNQPAPPQRLIDRVGAYIASNSQAFVIIIIGLFVIYMFYRAVSTDFLKSLATAEAARSLITFLFGIATVSIAIISVIGALLSPGEKEERDERFQHSKDVLTVLIGVFGTIIGFYFGQSTTQRPLQPDTTQTGESQAGSSKTTVFQTPTPTPVLAPQPPPPQQTGPVPGTGGEGAPKP
jgi:hypothetical protein